RPPKPDFIVNFSPDTLRVARRSYTIVNVEAQRQAGFGGAVEAWLENLPAGVPAEPLLVPPDSALSPLIVLHADETAPLGHHRIKLAASGVLGGQKVDREGRPQANGRAVRE